jgi:hypothetical protein
MGSSPRSVRTERDVPYSKYASGGTAEDECHLSFVTKLMKPSTATAKLQVENILRISVDAKNGIATYDNSGDFCGYITEIAFEKKMLECLKKGKDYQAEVLKKVGESCEVKVYSI